MASWVGRGGDAGFAVRRGQRGGIDAARGQSHGIRAQARRRAVGKGTEVQDGRQGGAAAFGRRRHGADGAHLPASGKHCRGLSRRHRAHAGSGHVGDGHDHASRHALLERAGPLLQQEAPRHVRHPAVHAGRPFRHGRPQHGGARGDARRVGRGRGHRVPARPLVDCLPVRRAREEPDARLDERVRLVSVVHPKHGGGLGGARRLEAGVFVLSHLRPRPGAAGPVPSRLQAREEGGGGQGAGEGAAQREDVACGHRHAAVHGAGHGRHVQAVPVRRAKRPG